MAQSTHARQGITKDPCAQNRHLTRTSQLAITSLYNAAVLLKTGADCFCAEPYIISAIHTGPAGIIAARQVAVVCLVLSVCHSLCLAVSLSLSLSRFFSLSLSLSRSLCLSPCLSVSLSLSLSFSRSLSLSLSLSLLLARSLSLSLFAFSLSLSLVLCLSPSLSRSLSLSLSLSVSLPLSLFVFPLNVKSGHASCTFGRHANFYGHPYPNNATMQKIGLITCAGSQSLCKS